MNTLIKLLRFEVKVLNQDRTGFNVLVTRTDTNDSTEGWDSILTVEYTIKKKADRTCLFL